ncbi:MAG: aminotransferase class I/II-fold pyridoxal phosphate-dependent enzyme [Tannerella sp.]|jgi:aspartate/methionine/tyrosine aminotransferase|nr:aminotransferase class I/II-fold pyridoxal phosphate-dependent enzyme [Tannerella sp.]
MQKENKVYDIQPADRIGKVEEYYFSRKLKEVAALNVAGKNIINLGIGSPDMPPSKEAIDVFCNEVRKDDVHGYQSYTGIPELRNGFAQWYDKWFGVKLDPNTEIQPLIGSKEGILHISMAFLNEGDGALIPNPGYPTYISVSKLVSADIVSYRLDEKNGWYPDFEELEKVVEERKCSGKRPIKLMWTNYPNMPTGANASMELYARLVEFGMRHNIVICNDNPYCFILNKQPISILSIDGAKDICIELNSMSKSQNMPGWRMAMCASNAQFIQWILRVKSNVDSGQFRPMQSAVVEALKAGEEWYGNNNKIYRQRRVLAGRIMEALDCTYEENQVGLFLWGKISDNEKSSESLADKVLYESNVFITPGFIFGSAGERYIRISLCCNEKMLQKALNSVETLRATSLKTHNVS